MTLAAEAPDLDVLWGFKGPVYNFAHHRGFTHSFLGLILVSAVVTGFMYLVWRARGKKTNIPELPPRWGLLFLFSYIAGLSHILLDFTNNYGVRPFWPFWGKWYSWDIVFIVEPALYIILIAGLLLPAVSARKGLVPCGRKHALAAIACLALFYALRDHEHRHAVESLRHQQFESASPLRVSVYPYAWDLNQWYAVVETTKSFVTSDIDSRSGQLSQPELEYFPKPPETDVTLAAKRSYLGRVYLDWAQYPLTTETVSDRGWIVHFRDLRYDYPRLRGRITLSCSVELNKELRVVREFFGSREQVPLVK